MILINQIYQCFFLQFISRFCNLICASTFLPSNNVLIHLLQTAFLSCPIFGRLSDRVGRKYCLLVTVIGTTLPVCIMAFTDNIIVYAVMVGLSGFFCATFPLTFAYISDCVADKRKRAPAFGLALATFGLSFCVGVRVYMCIMYIMYIICYI